MHLFKKVYKKSQPLVFLPQAFNLLGGIRPYRRHHIGEDVLGQVIKRGFTRLVSDPLAFSHFFIPFYIANILSIHRQ